MLPAEKPVHPDEPARCGSCGTALLGKYCHECGQQRIEHRLTTREFTEKFAKYMMKFDKAFLLTLWRAVRAPGELARDYLAGRRAAIVDPIRYFLATVFLQFLIATLAHYLSSAIQRPAFADTLGAVGKLVGLKFGVILLSAAIWRVIVRRNKYTTAEIAVFTIYCFSTLGLLWAVLPLFEVLLGLPLSGHRNVTIAVVLLFAAVYLTFGIRDFARAPLWSAAISAVAAMGLAYGTVVILVGIRRSLESLAPTLGVH
jgi:uncharacterized protein DUF3667